MMTVGLILFFLPFICWGLGCVVIILSTLLLGFCALARGMRGIDLVKIVQGLMITTTVNLFVLSFVDIGINCAASMFPVLIFSMGFVGIILGTLYVIVDTVKLACIQRWGVTLEAKVHKRRRHCIKNDNGGVTYEHKLLVSYVVEASHQSYWRAFRYQGVSSSTTEAVLAGEECQVVTCMESRNNGAMHQIQILDEGRPIEQGLEQEKTNENAIWSTRQFTQKWLSANESQYYGSRNDFVEVSALPSWPKVAVTTNTLSQFKPCGNIILIVALTVVATAFSIPGVFMPREMFFKDDGSRDLCNMWHVKASYILATILLPSVVTLVVVVPNSEESDSHAPNESSNSQELPIVRQSTPGTAAADDETVSTSDLYMEEDVLHSIT